MDTFPHWKRVWQTVSGISETVTENDVMEVLSAVGDDLVLGLSKYTAYTNASFALWTKTVKTNNNSKLDMIIKRISKAINLDVQLTWQLFCNFLMFVYHGKLEDVQKIADSEMQLENLVKVFKHFYSMERMYCLKTLHHILNNFNNKHNRFQKCYADFIADVPIITIRAFLITQLSQLDKEIVRHKHNRQKDPLIITANEMKEIYLLLIASSATWKLSHRQDMGDMADDSSITKQFLDQFVQLAQIAARRNYLELLYPCGDSVLHNLHYAQIAAVLVHQFGQDRDCAELPTEQRVNLQNGFLSNENNNISALYWALNQARNTYNTHDIKERYAQIIRNTLATGALRNLTDLCESEFIQSLAEAHQIRLAIYKVFQQLYNIVEMEDEFWFRVGSVPLLAALLKDKRIAKELLIKGSEGCLTPEGPYQLLAKTERMFPHDFKSFSCLMSAQLQHDEFRQQVIAKLESLTYFTEEFYEVVKERRTYKTLRENFPMVEANIVAMRQLRGQNLVVYETKGYAYIDVLKHVIRHLLNQAWEDDCNTDFNYEMEMVLIEALPGLDLLLDLLNHPANFATRNVLSGCIDQVFRIVAHYLPTPKYNHEVIFRCLMLCVKFMPISSEKVLYYLSLNQILPRMSSDAQSLLVDNTLTRITARDTIIGNLKNIVEFAVGMIEYCIKSGEYYHNVQLPLTMFVIEHIFPTFTLTWDSCNDCHKLATVARILQLLHRAIQKEFTELYYLQCLGMVLTNEQFIEAFFIIFGNIKPTLEQAVLCQSNWEGGQNVGVQLSKLCVNIILLLIDKTGGTSGFLKQPFGVAFAQTSLKAMNNLKVLAGLINHSLDPELSEASCKLLIKFAQNSSVPMLAHLDMDSNQVRGMFLEKLRDPLESNSIKIAIIDLTAASIKCQFGLTAAFFNVSERKDRPRDLSDNLSGFIIEFLKNMEQSEEYLFSPRAESVLNLIHQLWLANDVNLTSVTNIKHFWTYLTQPLLADLKLPANVYSEILHILSIHLRTTTGDNDAEFNSIMEHLYQAKADSLIQKLFRHVKDKDIRLIHAIRNFLSMSIENKPELFEDHDVRHDISHHCLKGIVEHMKRASDCEIINTWSATYLHLITKWERTCINLTDLSLLTDTINCFDNYYQCAAIPYQENLLTIACKTIQFFKDHEPNTFKAFVDAMRKILIKEQAMFAVQDKVSKNWMLLIIFSRNLIDLEWASKYKTWFSISNLICDIFTTVTRFIGKRETLPVAKVAMETLVKYVQSGMYFDVSVSDLESFYFNIKPPTEFLRIDSYDFNKADSMKWPFETFWRTYTTLIHLNIILLRKSPSRYLNSCFTFFSMHWVTIEALIMLPRYTVEWTALDLVQSILDLGCELLEFKDEWCRSEIGPKTLTQFLQVVNQCMNSCTQVMLSPNIIKFFSFSNLELVHLEDVASTNITEIMNLLLQIITTSSLCYNQVSPSIIMLMDSDVRKMKISDLVSIERDFTIPQISKSLKNRLTYGNLLYLMQILCESLRKVRVTEDKSILQTDIDSMDISQNSNDQEHQREITLTEDGASDNLLAFISPNFVKDAINGKTLLNLNRFSDNLSVDRTTFALESLGTYLASQIYQLVTDENIDNIDSSYYRWCLCMELQMLHEYTMRRYGMDVSTQICHRGHPVQYIMAPSQRLRSRNSDDSEDGSECSNWGIAADVNPSFPDAFIAWRDSEINDNFIKPCFPEYEVVEEMVSEEYYMVMISHWFRKICKLSD